MATNVFSVPKFELKLVEFWRRKSELNLSNFGGQKKWQQNQFSSSKKWQQMFFWCQNLSWSFSNFGNQNLSSSFSNFGNQNLSWNFKKSAFRKFSSRFMLIKKKKPIKKKLYPNGSLINIVAQIMDLSNRKCGYQRYNSVMVFCFLNS